MAETLASPHQSMSVLFVIHLRQNSCSWTAVVLLSSKDPTKIVLQNWETGEGHIHYRKHLKLKTLRLWENSGELSWVFSCSKVAPRSRTSIYGPSWRWDTTLVGPMAHTSTFGQLQALNYQVPLWQWLYCLSIANSNTEGGEGWIYVCEAVAKTFTCVKMRATQLWRKEQLPGVWS